MNEVRQKLDRLRVDLPTMSNAELNDLIARLEDARFLIARIGSRSMFTFEVSCVVGEDNVGIYYARRPADFDEQGIPRLGSPVGIGDTSYEAIANLCLAIDEMLSSQYLEGQSGRPPADREDTRDG